MDAYKYFVYFEKGMDGNIIAECPAFKGCHTQGKDMDEVKAKIKEVIELCIEETLEEGSELPEDVYFEKVNVTV